MAWKDGSRFLVAEGVKWGSGPKVYKGSSKDTTWNKDLLWKLYVEHEAKQTGIPLPKDHADVEAMPPFMKPLAQAVNAGYKPAKFKDPFRHDPAKTCQVNTGRSSPLRALRKKMLYPDIAAEEGPPRRRIRSDQSIAGTPTSSARRRHAAAAAADLARSNSSGGIALNSARSRASVRAATAQASARSSTTRRLAKIEEALERERLERQSLSESLAQERRQREAVEANLRQMRESMKNTEASAAKLAQYEKIMGNLMKTMKGAEARKSARNSARSGMRSSRSTQQF